MALIFMDGFDCYDDADDAVSAGWGRTSASTQTFSTSDGRYGGGALLNTSQSSAWRIGFPPAAPGDTVIIAFAYYHDGLGGGTDQWIQLNNEATGVLASAKHDNSGSVTIQREGGYTVVDTSAGSPLTANTWHWIEFKVVLGTNGTNGEIYLYIDGIEECSVTGTDTFIGTTTLIGRLSLYGGNGDCKYDDLVVMNGSGSDFNDIIGDCRISTVNVNGAGGTDNWSVNTGTNYQAVDDAEAASDEDTTYIYSATAAQESRFALASLSYTPSSIGAVQIRGKARKDAAGNRTIRGLFNVNAGSSEELGNTVGLVTTYSWARLGIRSLALDGAAWNETKFNDLEIGVEVVS